jgi:hypothetical protein
MTDERKTPAVESIYVSPVEGGWSVRCSLSEQAQVFLSGAKAEDSARKLAKQFASAGRDAEVIVQDRHGDVAGSTLYPAGV